MKKNKSEETFRKCMIKPILSWKPRKQWRPTPLSKCSWGPLHTWKYCKCSWWSPPWNSRSSSSPCAQTSLSLQRSTFQPQINRTQSKLNPHRISDLLLFQSRKDIRPNCRGYRRVQSDSSSGIRSRKLSLSATPSRTKSVGWLKVKCRKSEIQEGSRISTRIMRKTSCRIAFAIVSLRSPQILSL